MVGADHGAKEGAKVGALGSVTPGIELLKASRGDARVAMFGLVLLAAGAAIAPAAAGVGAAVGALRAPSADMVERTGEALARALDDANLYDTLAYRIMEVGGEHPIFSAADPDAPAVDTWFVLDSALVRLLSDDPTEWRPDLRLRVSLRGRLLRASDGTELGAWSWVHEGRKASFSEWAANDASVFRAELERAGRALALQVIRDLY